MVNAESPTTMAQNHDQARTQDEHPHAQAVHLANTALKDTHIQSKVCRSTSTPRRNATKVDGAADKLLAELENPIFHPCCDNEDNWLRLRELNDVIQIARQMSAECREDDLVLYSESPYETYRTIEDTYMVVDKLTEARKHVVSGHSPGCTRGSARESALGGVARALQVNLANPCDNDSIASSISAPPITRSKRR